MSPTIFANLFKGIIETKIANRKPCIPFIYNYRKDKHSRARLFALFIALMFENYEQYILLNFD